MIDLSRITSFDWDQGNSRKNEKHSVSMAEAEQFFFNTPLLVLEDVKHSTREPRLHALGHSDDKRRLHITFTLRHAGEKIRVISARDMHAKERAIYEKET
ncbi:MAG: BrnT family toxin [Gammaproteobacteria bacterium]